MQNRALFVLSTSRNVRDFYSNNLSSNSLLPKIMNIAEFFGEVIYVPDRRRATDMESLLYMRNAINMVENISSILNIKDEFLVFLKNSNYIFSFFKELSKEKKRVADLSIADTYANYDEHLTILDNLGRIYKQSLDELGLYDDITISDYYEINPNFISNFDRIELRIDGILTLLEWEILIKISEKIPLILNFDCSKFNQKTIEKIRNFTNLNFKTAHNYKLNLSDKSIESKTKLNQNPNINIKGFSIRSLQAAFVFDEISNMIRDGIKPQDIAVILPDESFALILQNLDENNMLNYAMGKSLKNSQIYTLLHTIKEAISQGLEYEFDENYIQNSKELNQLIATLNSFKIPTQIYQDIQNMFYSKAKFDSFENAIKSLLNGIKRVDEIDEIIENELFSIKTLLRQIELKFSDVLELFLINFSSKTQSMAGGGLVSVIGILESRFKSYDGVIIVDFNDSLVPKRSQKEMFLSSAVRKNAGLISHSDRENLQRFYYESLINRAKRVSISYVENDENIVSRFIRDFEGVKKIEISQISYENALNKGGIAIDLTPRDIVETHDFFAEPISFSRLDTYLKCKRRYYYKYIKKIKESRFYDRDALDFGTLVHEALEEYFKQSNAKFDKSEFLQIYSKYQKDTTLKSETFKLKLDEFASSQNSHFKDGFSVSECEKKIEAKFNGIFIKGKIDRVDINGNDIWLIDYKSGKADEKSLQLAFYELLYQAKFDKTAKGYFYSFDDNKFTNSKADIDKLIEVLDELKEMSNSQIPFSQDTKHCDICPYESLCLRGLR
ncbi:exonuclease V, helicase AddB [Campylobacter hyointestinalis subsp. lawsonii CCUG 27631]|uniref:PD-(D/E)XK nuclease family protein n=1 Tax=Campylobacter hyointestinalis TaxID=198 RepID=UPI0007C8B697|nr:PD-(D/E)XK nuclease family protein [Campylobacter hyointestinalis]ANE34944.1 exonuclease V, helicase AddB [Campylobacter hyointestinalis subsp. lawsonii CCUG 27631]